MNKLKLYLQKGGFLKVVKEKKKVIFTILFLLLAFFVYFINGKYTIANPSTEFVTIVPVKEKTLTKSIIVSGEIVSNDEIDLGFDSSGQLTAVNVKEGQFIRKGVLVAKVENQTQRAQLTQALGALKSSRAQVESAEAQLQKLISGSTQEDKDISGSQVSSARASLLSAKETARNTLQNAYAGTVSAVLFGTDVCIDNADSVNPVLTFQSTQYSAKISSENQRVMVGNILDRHNKQSAYNVSDKDLSKELSTTKEELIKLREFTDTLLIALNGAIPTSSMPSSTINSYITTITSARAQILSNITSITTAQNAILSAEKALITTEKNENKVVADVRQEDVDVARAGVNAAKASVISAEGNYEIAKSTLEKTYLYSPISGIVANVYKDAGEFVSASTPIVKITSKDKYISALVSEVDIAKVSVGTSVQVKLDAFKDRVFSGTIDFIYPDKKEILGIVYYEVKVGVDFDYLKDITILPGMSLDVIIPYAKKDVALAIDRSVTKKEGDKYFVQILNPNKKKPIDPKFAKVFFKAGFVGDKYIEVISGIDAETEIIKFLQETKTKKK